MCFVFRLRLLLSFFFFFLMIRRPPRSTRTDTLVPYTTLFRSVRIVATAQHRQMLDQVLVAFGLAPDIDLDIMRPDQSLPELTARLLLRLDRVFADEAPDAVLAQGDTTTAMAVALAAFYRRIPVGHVEAGLRTEIGRAHV